jgi:transcriptional regulator with XRE-family HTH domain
MKAAQWIDLVKNYRQWGSDYRTAKELGLSRNTISMYRSRTPTMDEETAVVIADALEIDPATVVLDQVAERSKSEAVREALSEHLLSSADDVMIPGFTAEERRQIREEVQLYGAAAVNLEKVEKLKSKGRASVAMLLATAIVSIAGYAPNAEATALSPAHQQTGSLYIMLS